jgi:DNA topoisomerase-3
MGGADVILREKFGFPAFRPYQEAVCQAVAEGKDVLLVMPTGAGKSLCYQLPGLVRGGTTLVVSPLIALMEDQVSKLAALGVRVDRIHSGRRREMSRSACRAYLDGALDFLFIAPERLKVPGFPEMLARRRPSLVAVDEAHCISHWGHDFRPEYRMLGDRLPLLRPSPFIALTATATPAVQDDIVAQLRLERPERFIAGFRRVNIAVEIVEKPVSGRPDAVSALLSQPARRPAIVYVPTRREAESTARLLSSAMRSAPYHAGMATDERNVVQREFLIGRVEVVVATIAFGMGVDKPDVRTVAHTALPGSLEGYYQEIGRAGRDGLPARAVLFHSFGDTRTHEFFHQRDYPPVETLSALFERLGDEPIPKEGLRRRAGLSADVFDKSLEKLWLFGGARIGPDESICRGERDFSTAYERQVAHRLAQIASMQRFAEGSACRMAQLVAHFGDIADSNTHCGLCDVCAPDQCVAQIHRKPKAAEESAARRILIELGQRDGRTVGQIHRDLFAEEGLDRRTLERVLRALVRIGAIALEEEAFIKDGAPIHYRRVYLTAVGRAKPKSVTVVSYIAEEPSAKKRVTRRAGSRRAAQQATGEANHPALLEALRQWRLSEARRSGVPAFRILTDRTLQAVVAAAPRDEGALLQVYGVGPAVVRRYGAALLDIVLRHDSGSSAES